MPSGSIIDSISDIEDLLAERGITVSYESNRLWCNKFGPEYTKRLKCRHQGFGDTFYIDEVFVKIGGKQQYLWRAVDQDGEVVDVFLQARRDGAAAKRFFRRLLKNHHGELRKIVTDKLRSYGVAHRELIPEALHEHLGQRYVKYINRTYKRSGTLWEGRFRSSLTQSTDYVLACYRYIELNPVRANMVSHPRGYPWSSYCVNAEAKTSDLITPHEEYLALAECNQSRQQAYRNLFNAHMDSDVINDIRTSTNGNFTLGSERLRRKYQLC